MKLSNRVAVCIALTAGGIGLSNHLTAQQLKEWQAPTPWRLQQAKRAAEDARAAAMKAGVVYKNSSFWARFRDPTTMQAIFDGDPQWLATSRLGLYFSSFVSIYSARCRDQLPSEVVYFKVTEKSVTRNGFGSIRGRSESSREWYVDPRFAGAFERRMQSNEADNFGLIWGSVLEMAGQAKGPSSGILIGIPADVRTMFESAPCDSATMYQFKENLLRMELGMPGLVKTGPPIRNAEAESDPPG